MHTIDPLSYRYILAYPDRLRPSFLRAVATDQFAPYPTLYTPGEVVALDVHADIFDLAIEERSIITERDDTGEAVKTELRHCLCVYDSQRIGSGAALLRHFAFPNTPSPISIEDYVALTDAFQIALPELWIDFNSLEDCGTQCFVQDKESSNHLTNPAAVWPELSFAITRTDTGALHIRVTKEEEVYFETTVQIVEADRIDVDNTSSPGPLFAFLPPEPLQENEVPPEAYTANPIIYGQDAFAQNNDTATFYLERGKAYRFAQLENSGQVPGETTLRISHQALVLRDTAAVKHTETLLSATVQEKGYEIPLRHWHRESIKRVDNPLNSVEVWFKTNLTAGTIIYQHEYAPEALELQELRNIYQAPVCNLLLNNLSNPSRVLLNIEWKNDTLLDDTIQSGTLSPYSCFAVTRPVVTNDLQEAIGQAQISSIRLSLIGPFTNGFSLTTAIIHAKVYVANAGSPVVTDIRQGCTLSRSEKGGLDHYECLISSSFIDYVNSGRNVELLIEALPLEVIPMINSAHMVANIYTQTDPTSLTPVNYESQTPLAPTYETRYIQPGRRFFLADAEYTEILTGTDDRYAGPHLETTVQISPLLLAYRWTFGELLSNAGSNYNLPSEVAGVITWSDLTQRLSYAPILISCTGTMYVIIKAPVWSDLRYGLWDTLAGEVVDEAGESIPAGGRAAHTLTYNDYTLKQAKVGGTTLQMELDTFNRDTFIAWIFKPESTDLESRWQLVDRFSNPVSTSIPQSGTYTAIDKSDTDLIETILKSGGFAGGYGTTGEFLPDDLYDRTQGSNEDTTEGLPGADDGDNPEGGDTPGTGGEGANTPPVLLAQLNKILFADAAENEQNRLRNLLVRIEFLEETYHEISCTATPESAGDGLTITQSDNESGDALLERRFVVKQPITSTLTGIPEGALLVADAEVLSDALRVKLTAHCNVPTHPYKITIKTTKAGEIVSRTQTGTFKRTILL